MIDHRRDHALEAQEHAELNGDEHDRKDDPNNRCDQPKAVMNKIAEGERENQIYRAKQHM